MTVKSSAVSVATTPTRLDTIDETDGASGSRVFVHNNGATTIFIGGSGVTIANGIPVAAGVTFPDALPLATGEGVYGVVAAATAEARVLETGV